MAEVRDAQDQATRDDCLIVKSISLDAVARVRAPGLRARVESAFADACNLVTASGERFALVTQHVGDGPLNALVDCAEALRRLTPGAEICGDGCWLELAPGLPDYGRLALRPDRVQKHVAWLRQVIPLIAPAASLAAQPSTTAHDKVGNQVAHSMVQVQASILTHGLLAAYRQHDLAGIRTQARQLAGLGPGLTPAGDDWLAGWLIGLRAVAGMVPGSAALPLDAVGTVVVEAAAGRTTGFSLAHLRAAGQGAAPKVWHDFLTALTEEDPCPIQGAARAILRRGATSGADMLAGFLAGCSH